MRVTVMGRMRVGHSHHSDGRIVTRSRLRSRPTAWGRGGLPPRSGGGGLPPRIGRPRGREALKRRTATTYAGFPGAQLRCAFAPGIPGLGSLRVTVIER